MEPQHLTQDIGDTDLSYLDYGGDGPPLILLHATGFVPRQWHPVARELASGWRVIAPYFCDHRPAEPDQGGLAWMTIAHDLARFARELSLERPALVGHSMGATVLTLAVGSGDLESRSMVLIEPIFLPEDFYRTRMAVDDHPLAAKAMRRRDHWSDRDEARNYLKGKAMFQNWDDEMLDLYIDYGMRPDEGGGLALTCSPFREASLFMGGVQYDPWPLLAKVPCPTLILEGEESENRSFIDLKKAASLFPRATYHLVEKAGHLIPMEKPAETTDIIREFLSAEASAA